MVDTPQGPAGPDPSFDPLTGGPERERHDLDPLSELAGRPAEGAREARPGEAFSQPWQGGGGEDFLELGGEGGGAPSLDDFAGTDPFGGPGRAPEGELEAEPPLPVSAVGVAEGFEDPLAADAELDGGFDEDWSDGAFEEDAGWLMEFDDESDGGLLEVGVDGEEPPEPVAASGARVWLGRAALVALSLGAGFVLSKTLSDRAGDGGGTEVARRDGGAGGASWRSGKGGAKSATEPAAPKTGAQDQGAPEGGAAQPPQVAGGATRPGADASTEPTTTGPSAPTTTAQDAPAGDGASEAPTDPRPRVGPKVAGGGTTGGATPDRDALVDDLLGSDPTRLTEKLPPFLRPGGETGDLADATPGGGAPTIETPVDPTPGAGRPGRGLAGRDSRGLSLPSDDVLALPVVDSPVREATAAELENLWLQASVPMDRIDAPRRLLTPVVGRVRVHLYAGEVFEGNLYAVGERKVWLESALGRIGLDGYQVRRIDRIASEEGTPTLGATGSQNLAGLPRVRVRTPGGVFYGKQLARVGDTVTLITADGARITLDGARVEPAGTSRTRLIDARGLEAAAPTEQKP